LVEIIVKVPPVFGCWVVGVVVVVGVEVGVEGLVVVVVKGMVVVVVVVVVVVEDLLQPIVPRAKMPTNKIVIQNASVLFRTLSSLFLERFTKDKIYPRSYNPQSQLSK
jgi:hypothetical protein